MNDHNSLLPPPSGPPPLGGALRASRHPTARSLTALAAAGLTTGALLLGGCGSASKPAYCTQVTNFEKAIQALGNVSLGSSTNGLLPVLQNVDSSAAALASAVKSEFAPEVAALKSSLTALDNTAKQLAGLPGSQALSQAAATIPAEVSAVKTAATNLVNATKSRCQ
jgi:hypothetical protein